MAVALDIPVKATVRAYYEHPANFGADMVANQRSVVGAIVTSVMSFYPIDVDVLPVAERKPKEDLVNMRVVVEHKLNVSMMMYHHLRSIGELLERMYEREFVAFCVGRAMVMPNYEAAVKAWGERYFGGNDEWDWEGFKRHVHKKYADNLKLLFDEEEKRRLERLKNAGVGVYRV